MPVGGGFVAEQFSYIHSSDPADQWCALACEVPAGPVFTWTDEDGSECYLQKDRRDAISACVRPLIEVQSGA